MAEYEVLVQGCCLEALELIGIPRELEPAGGADYCQVDPFADTRAAKPQGPPRGAEEARSAPAGRRQACEIIMDRRHEVPWWLALVAGAGTQTEGVYFEVSALVLAIF